MATNNVWETVVWEKLNKVGKWCPYSEEVCHLLEQSVKRNLSTVWLGDADVNLRLYHVKLSEFVQISETTGTHSPIRRSVRRRCFPVDSAIGNGIMWQWSGDRHNTWHNYDVDVNNHIEEAYKNGKELIDLSENFPHYNYKLNLRKMEQRNKRTKGRRFIRRAFASPFPVVKCSQTDTKGKQSTDDKECNSISSESNSISATSSSECSPRKTPSKPLIKHVAKFWNKLKNPVDTDSDKSDSESLFNKKQCTDNINTVQMGANSNQSSNIPNINISEGSHSGYSASRIHDSHEEFKYAIVNGKPWYHHWTPHISESDLKPVPGINIPVPFVKKSIRKKGCPTVNIGSDVESVLNQFTETFPVVSIPDDADKECIICFEDLFADSSYSSDNTVVKLQLCRHIFHRSCLKAMYESGNKDGCIQCPVCKIIHGEKCGTQPPGTMVFHILPHSLPGYSNCNTIRIIYDIPSGVQGPEHPQPGKRYTARGFPRRCYLPDSEDGRKVLRLLVKAWERRLIFTVGSSTTTGEESTVTWNEIHHKTEFGSNTFGHGFPDPNYFANVIQELAAHGVTEP